MTPLRLYHLGPSPNCMKARIALGVKEVPYEPVMVDPQDRAPIVEATGQPLTPAIVHGQVKLYDSAAILRYVNANFHGADLFAEDRETFREIEDWEMYARAGLRDSLGAAYTMAFGAIEPTAENFEKVHGAVRKAADSFEARLAEQGDWLVGGRLTAADVTGAAVWSYFAMPGHPAFAAGPFGGFIGEHFPLPEHPLVQAWTTRTMAHDAWMAQPA